MVVPGEITASPFTMLPLPTPAWRGHWSNMPRSRCENESSLKSNFSRAERIARGAGMDAGESRLFQNHHFILLQCAD